MLVLLGEIMSKKIVGAFTFNDEAHLIVMQIETMLRVCDEVVALSDDPTHLAYDIAKSYEGLNFHLVKNDKVDRFNQRDEQGDRNRLLLIAKALGAEIYYYTDLDEIIRMEDIPAMISIMNALPPDKKLSLRRYDLWRNAYTYRLVRDPNNSEKQGVNVPSPYTTEYACNLKFALEFDKRPIPNFHAARMPNFSVPQTTHLHERVKVIHYGYFNSALVDKKRDFYLKNSSVSNVTWGEDMRVSDTEYIKKWGAGYYKR